VFLTGPGVINTEIRDFQTPFGGLDLYYGSLGISIPFDIVDECFFPEGSYLWVLFELGTRT